VTTKIEKESNIKVLFLSSSSHPIVEELKEELSRLGVKVTTLYLQDIGIISSKSAITSFLLLIKLLRKSPYLVLRSINIVLKSGLKIRNLMRYARYFIIAAFIHKILVKNDFDIVHAFWSYPAGISAILVKALVHKPVVISLLGYDVDERTLNDTFLTNVSKFAIENCDAVIVAAENHYNNLLSIGVNRNMLYFIPLGVNVTKFNKVCDLSLRKRLGISENEIVVLFAPHLRDLYGPEDFLRAAGIISRKVNSVCFVLVGDGPLREYLKTLAKSLGVKAVFTGHINFHEMPSYYAIADIVCIPSYAGQGISALEAMAAGKPVVGYKTGTIRIADGIDGFLVQKGDIRELAEKILLLIEDSSLRCVMGNNARIKVISQYDIRLCASRILSLYNSVIKHQLKREVCERRMA
jgi:glycosyltransferase involved in cell wall biosynthesis